tara:strand:- start:1632 stop:2408 length:777 start_codon:yes stop_codon:yes gene_type:complete
MKSLLKKLAKSNFASIIRNTINIKPIYLKTFDKDYFTTVSDAFLWRTDNGYKTKFKYSNILSLFYNINDSWVEFHFYTKENKLIKTYKVNSLDISNELVINSGFLNDIEDFGVFYIYHFTKQTEHLDDKSIISNRCYLGYSSNNNLYSFVHGNILAKFTDINAKKKISSDIIKTSLFKNQIYTIQKYFDNLDKNELFFINPTSKKIKFSITDENYILNPHCVILLQIKNSIISIKSNCMFLRPTVFSYKDQYIDVHHS